MFNVSLHLSYHLVRTLLDISLVKAKLKSELESKKKTAELSKKSCSEVNDISKVTSSVISINITESNDIG